MAFPSIEPNGVILDSVIPVKTTSTMNGIEQRELGAGQFFTLTLDFLTLTKSQQRELMGFYHAQQGSLSSFSYTLPDYLGNSSGSSTGNMTLASGITAGATTMTISAPSGTNPVFRQGDLIKFSGHNKVYMLTEDVSSGETSVTFYPPARESVTTGTTVTAQNVPITVRFVSGGVSTEIGPAEFANITFDLREVL